MSETKPTSGDATLDALVRDLSAKVKATDGRWVAENEPKEGAKSIYDDFEGAIADAPRIDSHPDDARHAVEAAADALEEQLAAFEQGGIGSAGVPIVDINSMDVASMLGGGEGAEEFNSFADDIVARMLAYEEKKKETGGAALGEAIGSNDNSGGLMGKFDDVGDKFAGLGLEVVDNGEGGDGELKGLMATLSSQLREEKSKKGGK
jgi:hypothetical protein